MHNTGTDSKPSLGGQASDIGALLGPTRACPVPVLAAEGMSSPFGQRTSYCWPMSMCRCGTRQGCV